LLETEEAAAGYHVTCLQLRTELEESKAAHEILASEVHKIMHLHAQSTKTLNPKHTHVQ
jgi:hypothetical protein